jgi:hypothetical protein
VTWVDLSFGAALRAARFQVEAGSGASLKIIMLPFRALPPDQLVGMSAYFPRCHLILGGPILLEIWPFESYGVLRLYLAALLLRIFLPATGAPLASAPR